MAACSLMALSAWMATTGAALAARGQDGNCNYGPREFTPPGSGAAA